MQESNNTLRYKVLVTVAFSSIVLMISAKVVQILLEIEILPIVWKVTDIALSVGIAISIVVFTNFLYFLWPSYRRSVDVYVEPLVAPLEWWDLIWLGLLPGLSEELFFRGMMLSAFGEDLMAVIFSSVVFGILHLRGLQYWSYGLIITLVSLILGYSAIVTGNLLVPILIHILINPLSCSLWKYNQLKSL